MQMSAFGTAVLTCVVVGHPPPAVAQVDQQRAQEYFKEAEVQSRLQVARELCRNCVRWEFHSIDPSGVGASDCPVTRTGRSGPLRA